MHNINRCGVGKTYSGQYPLGYIFVKRAPDSLLNSKQKFKII